ncbi:MAG TPA: serpin family protein [Gemmataceae bacterium]|nr:serpin family protein [Gemmataceae bacterium]
MNWLIPVLALASTITYTSVPDEKIKEPAVDAELVKNGNRFALEWYAKAKDDSRNLIISPLSATTAMGMTYSGARGQTAKEMAAILRFPPEQAKLHSGMHGLLKKMTAKRASGELDIANSLWAQQGFALETDFLNTVKTQYGATVREIDFKDGANAAGRINDWVAKQTKNKIPALLEPGDLTPLTVLVLANTVYFKGNWQARFEKQATLDARFYRKPGDPVDVKMMSQLANFPYWGDNALQMIQLPYAGNQVSMLILLPGSADGLPDVEKSLTPDKLSELMAKLKEQKVNVHLPRFKARSRLDLKENLIAMGMKAAFDKDNANFTGMCPQLVHISKIVHEAIIEVNEEGTEAAGATAVEVEKKGPGPGVRFPTFDANRPFLYLIRDNSTGCILFMGRLRDPSK